jgi:outer membrane lipoprotein SlyB
MSSGCRSSGSIRRSPPGRWRFSAQQSGQDSHVAEIVATFRDMDRARAAMAALERHGVGSDAISLVGSGPARAAREEDTSQRDLQVARHVGSRAVFGLIVGTAGGGAIGLIVAAVVVGGFGSAWVWGATVAGGVAGGAIGMALGGYGTPAVSEDWELTHEPEPGTVGVAVRSTDRGELERAAEVLREADAESVRGPAG